MLLFIFLTGNYALLQTGVMLKPFLPQLQTTFIKAIHDPHRGVRLRSGSALSYLVAIHLKPDPMFVELQNSIKNEEDISIRETLIFCVRQVFTVAGGRVPEAIRKNITASLCQFMCSDHDGTRQVAAGALAAVLPHMAEPELKGTVTGSIITSDSSADWTVRHGRICATFSAIKQSSESLFKAVSEQQVASTLQSNLSAEENPLLLQATAIAVGSFILYKVTDGDGKVPSELLQPFSKLINNASNDVKQAMCSACQFVCEAIPQKMGEGAQLPIHLVKALVPALINGTKEKNQIVKSTAEMALVALLLMKEGDQGAQKIVSALDGGIKDALTDCITRSLRRAVYYPVTEAEMDITILT